MTPLWTAKDASRATGGKVISDWQATGVSIDTRSIEPGDLFVALKDIRDGHEFVADALHKGAAAALVDHIPEGVAETAPLLIVDDVLSGLEALGRAARARTCARIIGVTGSVGKTSTKEMLRAILAGQGRVHAAEHSYNNHWGVPLTLARMPVKCDFAVIEIGMSNPGETAPLAHLTRPDVALITTITAAHLAAFDSIAAIAREKSAIFQGLTPGGIAVISADLDETPVMAGLAAAAGARLVRFGKAAGAEYRLDDVKLTDETTIVQARHDGMPILFKIMSPGGHLAGNAMGALAVAAELGCDMAVAACDIANWVPPPGRGTKETIVMDVVDDHLTFVLLDDAFNANPASVRAALDMLAASQPIDDVGRVAAGRRIAILGDMLELGPEAAKMHRDIAAYPALARVDLVHCVGPAMSDLYETLPAR